MKFLLTTIVILFSIFNSYSQTVEISEAPRAIENSTYNSFLFEIVGADKDFVINEWEDFIKKSFKTKTKKDKASGLLLSGDAKMPELSGNRVNIYTRFLEDKSPIQKTSVIVWFSLGNENYVSTEANSNKGTYVHQLLTEFAIKTKRKQAEIIVKAEEKTLSELEKNLKDLEKDNKEYQKEIDKAKEIISKNEKNIKANELEQKKKNGEIKTQKEVLQKAKGAVKKLKN
jgi:hypothetical protein